MDLHASSTTLPLVSLSLTCLPPYEPDHSSILIAPAPRRPPQAHLLIPRNPSAPTVPGASSPTPARKHGRRHGILRHPRGETNGDRVGDQESLQETGYCPPPRFVALSRRSPPELSRTDRPCAPDKNHNDPTAHEKFQAIGEAYQVLSNDQLRAAYDKYGKDHAKPQEGFVDPAEFFTSIFGGDAFVDWIGEISLMKDLTTTMEITMANEGLEEEDAEFPGTEEAKKESMKEAEKQEKAGLASGSASAPPKVVVEDEKADLKSEDEKPSPAGFADAPGPESRTSPSPSASGTSTPRRTAIPIRPALMDRPSDDTATDEQKEAELRRKEKKKGLTKEQREQLAAYEKERARVRTERVDTLARKLVDRISVWTETDKGADVTAAFQGKTRLEVENLKMESFGLDILHAIGQTYVSKASAVLKSQKFLGFGGFLSRVRDKGTLVKETWNTISSAIDAQQTMEEMARMEERGGDEWTEERKVEYERRVTGKILTAAWRGSKFEIQSVLREVCDAVLNDKRVPLSKRLERAEALVLIGDIFLKVGGARAKRVMMLFPWHLLPCRLFALLVFCVVLLCLWVPSRRELSASVDRSRGLRFLKARCVLPRSSSFLVV